MKKLNLLLFLIFGLATTAQAQTQKRASITVQNPISSPRMSETITLKYELLKKAFPSTKIFSLRVTDSSNNVLVTQPVDTNGDGVVNEVLFQASFEPDESKVFTISPINKEKVDSSLVYAAYAPGRGLEDFAWENDLIGYRFYGLARAEEQGTGTGIDIWCKRVSYPLTDKWYHPETRYHRDTGFGADHYSAGKNQGCGGTGIYTSDKIHFSKAFSKWKIIAEGPIRTIFELEFSGWKFESLNIVETKRVTMDLGHYLNKFECGYLLEGDPSISDVPSSFLHAVGLVQRESSKTSIERADGWIAGWESLGRNKGELGTCMIVPASEIRDIKEIDGHLYTLLPLNIDKNTTYYTGAAWSEFGTIKSPADWQEHVGQQARRIANPCIVQLQD
jgi:hypothetical protein